MMTRAWLVMLIAFMSVMLGACATKPQAEKPLGLLQDQRFGAPKTPIHLADVFAIDQTMRQYLQQQFPSASEPSKDANARQVLTDALFTGGALRLDYDAAITRNAKETFHARAGNCLSLTIMAAALAKELGLSVHFQQVHSGHTWGRHEDLQLSISHVNLVVGERITHTRSRLGENALHTIDFMRYAENHVLPTTLISEETILAMFMNNRAAESLAEGNTNQAYWYAREAITIAPTFLPAYITLGVIYRRHGDIAYAEKVLAHVLQREPNNTIAMSNLITLLLASHRQTEAASWQQKLAAAQPISPFYYLDRGKLAMEAGDYGAARDFFRRELNRGTGNYNHEVHFWLANAYYRLGEYRQTKNHLDLAADYSPTRKDRDLYDAKRNALNRERVRERQPITTQ